MPSPLRWLKRAANGALNRLGYEVRRPSYGHHDDAFVAQRSLLASRAVRTVFDVGAHVGQTTTKYRVLFPEATIYCFEPFPDSFNIMVASVSAADQIHPYQLALSDEQGKQWFFVNTISATNSLLPFAADYANHFDPRLYQNLNRVEVSTDTLDNFTAGHDIHEIDLLKMDVQGAELAVVRGAKGLLADQRIRLIYTEVQFLPVYEGSADFCTLCKVLTGYGYGLYGLYDLNYAKGGTLAWCDAVFTRGKTPEA